MDEQELWTPADDETIRHALDSIRWESDALPLADVRFVKARGNSRRRRALVVRAPGGPPRLRGVGRVGQRARQHKHGTTNVAVHSGLSCFSSFGSFSSLHAT